MNGKKFFLAVVVAFVVTMITGVIVHGVLLGEDYKALGSQMRDEQGQGAHFPFMLIAHVLIAVGLAWIYGKGVEGKSWVGQGLRFGIALWLAASAGPYLIYFAVQPLPGALVVKQIVYGFFECLILGLALAALYRTKAGGAAA